MPCGCSDLGSDNRGKILYGRAEKESFLAVTPTPRVFTFSESYTRYFTFPLANLVQFWLPLRQRSRPRLDEVNKAAEMEKIRFSRKQHRMAERSIERGFWNPKSRYWVTLKRKKKLMPVGRVDQAVDRPELLVTHDRKYPQIHVARKNTVGTLTSVDASRICLSSNLVSRFRPQDTSIPPFIQGVQLDGQLLYNEAHRLHIQNPGAALRWPPLLGDMEPHGYQVNGSTKNSKCTVSIYSTSRLIGTRIGLLYPRSPDSIASGPLASPLSFVCTRTSLAA
ncbi:hypothetical protein EDB84DRAFT_558658 [Lactarius hengduanensis]|nr:hypothetical protein EDB84DRAFT_558658 [Lactarius hengduanensis]